MDTDIYDSAYVAPLGAFINNLLENRERRKASSHTTARATLRAAGGSADPYFSALEWSDGVGNIENKVFMRIRDATNHGYRTAWTLGEMPHFAAGETKEYLAESKDFDVVGGQLSPLPRIDYTANTQPDGTGDDITGQVSVTYPSMSVYNGKGTLVRVSFGSTAGYLTRLAMRTVNALTFNAPALVMAEDGDSRSAYGQRIRSIEARWTREAKVAQSTVVGRLARKALPRTALMVVMPNGSDANMLLMLQLRLSDRVAVRYQDMGVDGGFFVEGQRLEASRAHAATAGR